MTRDEALFRVTERASMGVSAAEAAIATALEHGATRLEVANAMGISDEKLMDRHGLIVRNAGKRGQFKHPLKAPRVADLDAD